MILNTKFYIFTLVCICAVVVGACTKDYFVSEDNVRLYVPELVRGEIENLTMVFHGSNGEFLMRKVFSSNDVQQLIGNVIKMSIPVNSLSGSPVVITCVSDLDSDFLSDDSDFNSSKLISSRAVEDANRFYPTLDYRFYRYRKIVKPLGVDSEKIDTLNVDSDHYHKGRIDLNFKSISAAVHSARIRYTGVGSSLDFYGEYKSEPSHYVEQRLVFLAESTTQSISGYFLPSVGEFCAENTHHGDQRDPVSSSTSSMSDSQEYLDLHIDFLDSTGALLGSYTLSEDTNPPTITNPDNTATLPADQIILKSQGKLHFEFDGFKLVSFELVGWGEVIDGETTPM